MEAIELVRKTNSVLVMVLLVAAILVGGYLVLRSQKPISVVHVAVDSTHLGKK